MDKALECLYELNRYETDDAFRKVVDERRGLESIQRRRQEIAATLVAGGIWRTAAH